MSIIGCIIFSVLYLGIGAHPILSIQPAPHTLLDDYVIFLPWTIVIYLSQFVFLWVGIWCAPNEQAATQTYYHYLFASIVATFVFVIFPTQIPQLDSNHLLLKSLYIIDVPNNCFPSLHTALALIAAFGLHQSNAWGKIAPIWATAIILSTLTTKQHYILDVGAGVVLFIITIRCCHKLLRVNADETIKI